MEPGFNQSCLTSKLRLYCWCVYFNTYLGILEIYVIIKINIIWVRTVESRSWKLVNLPSFENQEISHTVTCAHTCVHTYTYTCSLKVTIVTAHLFSFFCSCVLSVWYFCLRHQVLKCGLLELNSNPCRPPLIGLNRQ